MALFLPFELSRLRCAPEAGKERFYFTAVGLRSGVAGEEGLPEGRESVCLREEKGFAFSERPSLLWNFSRAAVGVVWDDSGWFPPPLPGCQRVGA